LLNVLLHPKTWLSLLEGFTPEIVSKEATPFVDRDRVPADLHDRIAGGEWNHHWIEYPSYGTDGVPYSDKMNQDIPTEGLLESLGNLEGVRHALGFLPTTSKLPGDIGNESFIVLFQKPIHVQKAAKRPGSIGATAKSEKVNVIAGS